MVTEKGDRLGYGDSFIMSPRGETLAEAGLFHTKLITARITPAMLRPSALGANPKEVPAELNARLGDLLKAGEKSP